MTTKDTGGPAFPEVRIKPGDNYNAPIKVHYGGMSLRDYFAAQALNGLMSIPGGGDPKTDAAYAYRIADAMLAAREAK